MKKELLIAKISSSVLVISALVNMILEVVVKKDNPLWILRITIWVIEIISLIVATVYVYKLRKSINKDKNSNNDKKASIS